VPRRELLKDVRRIVVKVGTSSLTEGEVLSPEKIARLANDIVGVVRRGYQVVLVSSGAISAGAGLMSRRRDFVTIPEKQALAAVGQILLMDQYRACFNAAGLEIGQILLTEDDVKNRRRYLNARHTFNALLEFGVVPIVNENDSVVIKEIKIGENDTLSAYVANIIEAELLVLLSDVDGFYRDLADPEPIEEVFDITDEIRDLAGGAGSAHGSGGMSTKIRAAEIVIGSGEMMIIANGAVEGVLGRIMNGEKIGTIFVGRDRALSSRKRWIAYSVKAAGTVIIDDGAVRALRERKKSLLARGITGVQGDFDLGDAVDIVDARGERIGKGIVNYNAKELQLIKGKKTDEIRDMLESNYFDEVVNRDDLIIY